MKFTIVTVCFNAAQSIEKTMRSVAGQDYVDLEHLVVDGASTDGTCEILADMADDRVTWFSERDEGIYDAMNKGIARATGDVLFFLNADDRFAAPDVLSAVADEFAGAPATQIVYGNVCHETDDGLVRLPQPELLDRRKLAKTTVCHQAIFARREAFNRVGGFERDLPVVSDWDWLYRATMVDGLPARYIDRDIAVIGMQGVSHTVKFEPEKRTALRRYYSEYEIFLYRVLPLNVRFAKEQIRRLVKRERPS